MPAPNLAGSRGPELANPGDIHRLDEDGRQPARPRQRCEHQSMVGTPAIDAGLAGCVHVAVLVGGIGVVLERPGDPAGNVVERLLRRGGPEWRSERADLVRITK